MLALQSDVAQAIARKVKVSVTGKEEQRLTASHTVLPEAYESYLKGLSSLSNSNTKAGIEKSIPYFEEAIRKDPAFAPAYVGFAEAHGHFTEPGRLYAEPRRLYMERCRLSVQRCDLYTERRRLFAERRRLFAK